MNRKRNGLKNTNNGRIRTFGLALVMVVGCCPVTAGAGTGVFDSGTAC